MQDRALDLFIISQFVYWFISILVCKDDRLVQEYFVVNGKLDILKWLSFKIPMSIGVSAFVIIGWYVFYEIANIQMHF